MAQAKSQMSTEGYAVLGPGATAVLQGAAPGSATRKVAEGEATKGTELLKTSQNRMGV